MTSIPARWALLDLTESEVATGFHLIATTDVPCHLFCRMSKAEPLTHPIPVMVRGTTWRTDVRFCFTVFEDNEQSEPGDTLVHTFIKVPWPICETRWFYFIGTISGQFSPSETAIFKLQRTLQTYIDIFPSAQGIETNIPTEWPRGSLHWQDVALPVSAGAYFVQHNTGAWWTRDLYQIDISALQPYGSITSVELWSYNVADWILKKMRFALKMPDWPLWQSEVFNIHDYGSLNPPVNPLPTTVSLPINPITNSPWKISDFTELQYGPNLLNDGIIGSATTYHMFIRVLKPVCT